MQLCAALSNKAKIHFGILPGFNLNIPPKPPKPPNNVNERIKQKKLLKS